MKRNRWLPLLASLVMLVSVFGTLPVMAEEKITLTFWHIWPSDQMGQIVDDYVAIYEAEHPNVTIESIATQEFEYQQTKLRIAASNKSQGDIFMSWGGGYAETYVDAGAVLPLDDYLTANNVYDELLDGSLTYGTYGDKVYGLPLKQWVGVLYCNHEMFEQYGAKLPDTFEELLDAVKIFVDNGVTPMALGAKDGWHIGMYQNALAVRTAGADYMNDALAGKVTLDTPEIVKSAQLLVELNEAGAFPRGTLGLGSEESQEEFLMGLIPMYYCGSWVASGVDNEDNAIKGKITPLPMPSVDGQKGDKTEFSGGVIDFMMVNSATKYPQQAFDFALGITKYMSQESYIIGDSLPAWKLEGIDDSNVSPTLIAINDLLQTSTGYVLAWDTFLKGAAIDTHYQLLQGLIAGTITPQEFATQMQAANEASLAQ
ncbi:MAG: extracellular solute-binding protein [Clostridiales bacterium]|nr:extracellular solute-binding protein [Clostridiales bacterium]